MVNGTGRTAAYLAKLALLIAFGGDGFAGEFADLELGPLRLFFGRWFVGTNLGVLVTRQRRAAFFLLPVGRTDLNQLRLRGDGFGNMGLDLRLVTGGVGTLCGIWANCKSSLLAPRQRTDRVGRAIDSFQNQASGLPVEKAKGRPES